MPSSADLEAAAVNSKVVKRAGSNAILATPTAETVLDDDDGANLLPDDFEIIKTGSGEFKTRLKQTDSTFVETTDVATTVADVISDLTTFDATFGPTVPEE
jgi:hypothetical protein